MTRGVRTFFFGGLVIVLIVGVTAAAFILRPGAALPPMPNPNGYDTLVRAAETIKGDINNYRDVGEEDLGRLVATNTEALRLARAGLTQQCSVDTTMMVTNFAARITDLTKMKRLAQLFAAEGRAAEMQNRPGDAAQSYLAAIRLGNASSHGGAIIHRLVGLACEAIGGTALVRLVPSLTCEQAKPVIAELERIDNERVTWDEVMRAEHFFMRHAMLRLLNPVTIISALWEGRAAKRISEVRHNLAVAHLRLIAAELALRCWQAAQSQPPASLAELAPKYLARVPLDPFNPGRPMTYRVQGTNWLLYSFGGDRVDDGGSAASRTAGTKGDVLYYSSW